MSLAPWIQYHVSNDAFFGLRPDIHSERCFPRVPSLGFLFSRKSFRCLSFSFALASSAWSSFGFRISVTQLIEHLLLFFSKPSRLGNWRDTPNTFVDPTPPIVIVNFSIWGSGCDPCFAGLTTGSCVVCVLDVGDGAVDACSGGWIAFEGIGWSCCCVDGGIEEAVGVLRVHGL